MATLSQGSQSALLHLRSLNPYIISSLDVARKQGMPVLLCMVLPFELPHVASMFVRKRSNYLVQQRLCISLRPQGAANMRG